MSVKQLSKKALFTGCLCAAGAEIATELRAQDLSDRDDVYLEPHAFAVQSGIRDRELRALHVMEG